MRLENLNSTLDDVEIMARIIDVDVDKNTWKFKNSSLMIQVNQQLASDNPDGDFLDKIRRQVISEIQMRTDSKALITGFDSIDKDGEFHILK